MSAWWSFLWFFIPLSAIAFTLFAVWAAHDRISRAEYCTCPAYCADCHSRWY